jgi:molybdopterin biosynthesis enzyme
VRDSGGRVLAGAVRSAVDLPPFASSAMDGYGARSSDTPGRLRVTGDSAAGFPGDGVLCAGDAFAVSTGAVVPDGADAVVPIERVVENGDVVKVPAVAEGDNVRHRGGDVRAGETVVAAGTRIGPTHVGAAAAVGVRTVRCAARPRVGVFATGSELQRPGEPLGRGQIRVELRNARRAACRCRRPGRATRACRRRCRSDTRGTFRRAWVRCARNLRLGLQASADRPCLAISPHACASSMRAPLAAPAPRRLRSF